MVTGPPATRTSLVLPQGEASSRHHGPDRTAELIHYTIGYSTPTLGVGPQLTRAPPGRIVSSAPGRSRISRSGDLQTLPWSRGGHAHVRRVTEQPSRMAHSEKAPVLWNCGRPMRSESTAGQHGPGPVSWPGQSDAPTELEFLVGWTVSAEEPRIRSRHVTASLFAAWATGAALGSKTDAMLRIQLCRVSHDRSKLQIREIHRGPGRGR